MQPPVRNAEVNTTTNTISFVGYRLAKGQDSGRLKMLGPIRASQDNIYLTQHRSMPDNVSAKHPRLIQIRNN